MKQSPSATRQSVKVRLRMSKSETGLLKGDKEMEFNAWLRRYTGLSLYDFRVLDKDGNSEKEVRDLFHAWLEDYKPIPSVVTKAIEAAANEGFDVFLM